MIVEQGETLINCLAAASVLCVVLAVAAIRAVNNMDRMTDALESVGRDVEDLKKQVEPVINEAGKVLQRTDDALKKIDTSLGQVNKGTQVFQQMAEDVRELEQDLVDRVRPPLQDLGSVAAGAIKGFTGLIKSLLDR